MIPVAMFKKITRPLIGLIGFILLCILFYMELMDALEKHKDSPIVSKQFQRKLSPAESKMQLLFETSTKWAALSRSNKRIKLLENPVYANFNITKASGRKKVTLLLIVSSGPRRVDRRNAIRQTWWKQCVQTYGVIPECIFFTDYQSPKDKFYEAVRKESELNKDMYFQPLRGGIEFGIRFLYHLVWAMTHYEFDYILRADDDYFFCLQRFMYELPQPMEKAFHWGYTHCILEIVRPEESMILLSHDLIETFLFQDPHKMRCHPWADQMMGVWTTDLMINNLYRHDDRLHHAPIVERQPELRTLKNICTKLIGIHGTYPEDMLLFWKNKGKNITNITSIVKRDKKLGNLLLNSEVCELVHNFNYLVFEPEWQYEPQRCIYFPLWDTKKQSVIGGVYSGRQDDKRLSAQDLKLLKKKLQGTEDKGLDSNEDHRVTF